MHRFYTATVEQPAAGADWVATPSTSDRSRLLSITAKLVTSAVAANRAPDLETRDETGNLIAIDRTAAVQVASGTTLYSWRSGAPQFGAVNNDPVISNSCPDFWLPAGATVGPITTAIDAGDQWSLVTVSYVLEDEWYRLQVEETIAQALGIG